MKKILFVLVAMLISISFFTYDAHAELDCLEGSTRGEILVEDDGCYKVIAVYCYTYNEENGGLDIRLVDLVFRHYSDDCITEGVPYESPIQKYKNAHWETVERYMDIIYKEIVATDLRVQIVFCNENETHVLSFSTAFCESTEPVWCGYGGTAQNPYDVWRYVPCSTDSFCLSIYNVCWEWSEDGLELVPVKKLIGRHADVNNNCPDNYIYNYPSPEMHPVELECEIMCD